MGGLKLVDLIRFFVRFVDHGLVGGVRILPLLAEGCKLFGAHEAQVHDVADVQVVNPVVSLFYSEVVSNSYLKFLVVLDLFYVFQISEANVKFVSFVHQVFLSVSVKKLNVSFSRILKVVL